MSRLLWVGVGAAGGIYLYRRGNRAWDEAKERGLAGNAAVVASSASTMLHHVKRTLAEAQEAKDAEMAEDRFIGLPVREPGQKPSYARQRELLGQRQNESAQDPLQGFWQDPQADEMYGVGSVHDSGRERPDSRHGRRVSRAAVSRRNPVRFITPRNRSSA